MKYDKHKEALPSKKKVVPVEERVKEEFWGREFDRKVFYFVLSFFCSSFITVLC